MPYSTFDEPDTELIQPMATKLNRLLVLRTELAGMDAKRKEVIELEKELDAVINPRAARAPRSPRKRSKPSTTPDVAKQAQAASRGGAEETTA